VASIGIIDLEIGNLRSVRNAIYENGFDPEFISEPEKCVEFDHIILPGVGAFHTAAHKLSQLGFRSALTEHRQKGKPLLGICLGMQLLAETGEEGGQISHGLGFVPGNIQRFPLDVIHPTPHVGWNNIEFQRKHFVTDGIRGGVDFYFVHSFFFSPSHQDHVIGTTDYGISFSSIVAHENSIGFQFHPEKSQMNGLKLLENFCRWKP
jgi:imidazole glycerol-phosphate synthase subunit HisH